MLSTGTFAIADTLLPPYARESIRSQKKSSSTKKSHEREGKKCGIHHDRGSAPSTYIESEAAVA